jgi:uncharacterized protein with HEPN domain
VLIHQYDRVDLYEVWRIISTECDDLLTRIEAYLETLGVHVPERPPDDETSAPCAE